MKYSGQTTCYEHKQGDFEDSKGKGGDCIIQETIFDVQWSNCPVEVEEEVKRLWRDNDLGNDDCYYQWDSTTEDEYDKNEYPLIHEYLKSRNVQLCLINWWW